MNDEQDFDVDNSAEQIDRNKANIIELVLCELCDLGASRKRMAVISALLCNVAGINESQLGN